MLQPPILELQRPQVPGRIHVLGRMFGSPAIERADRNPVFPARTCDSSLGTSLPQDLQLSFFTESRRHPSTFPCATLLGDRAHPSADKIRFTPLRHVRGTCIPDGGLLYSGETRRTSAIRAVYSARRWVKCSYVCAGSDVANNSRHGSQKMPVLIPLRFRGSVTRGKIETW